MTMTPEQEDEMLKNIPWDPSEPSPTYAAKPAKPKSAPSPEGKGADAKLAIKLVELVLGDPNITLFHDEYAVSYAQLAVGDHKEIWPCGGSQFKRWMAKSFYDTYNKALSSNTISSALNIIEAEAKFNGDEFKLHNRVAELDEAIYYDLADKQWRAVKVTAEGWMVVNETPILFKRYQHHALQIAPTAGGKVEDILSFINVTDPDHKVLVLVYLVSCFMPGFAHPIPYIYGQQGSAKSTFSKILRKLIDPSRLEVLSLPRKPEELSQVLAHHWFLFFDNVSYISHDTSDLLCRAVTGSGFSKRQLYTDDEDIIYNIQPNIGINGINLASAAPDLLERSMLFELKRVELQSRRDERELWKKFEEERPKILGAIFDAVAKTIKTRKGVTLTSLPRMADFVLVGCAIAEALGYTRDEFLQAYYRNINSQNEEVLAEHIEAMLVTALMDDRVEWSGSPAQLLEAVRAIGKGQSLDEKQLPKSANALSRKLNVLKTNLEASGIKITKNKGTKRTITLQKAADTVSTADAAQVEQQSHGGADDIEDGTDPLKWFEELPEIKAKDDKDGIDGNR